MRSRRRLAILTLLVLATGYRGAKDLLPPPRPLPVDLTQSFTLEDSTRTMIDWAHGPTPPLTKLWGFHSREPLGQPLVVEGRILVSDRHHQYAVDDVGNVVWSFRVPRGHNNIRGEISSSCVVGHLVVVAYVLDAELWVRALEVQTGNTAWTFSIPVPPSAYPSLHPAGDAVMVDFTLSYEPGVRDISTVLRVDARGTVLWSKDVPELVTFAERGNDLAIVTGAGEVDGDSRAGVEMVDARTGKRRWRWKAPNVRPLDGYLDVIAFTADRLLVREYDQSALLIMHSLDRRTGVAILSRAHYADPYKIYSDGNSTAYAPGTIYGYTTEGAFRIYPARDFHRGRALKAPSFMQFLLTDPTPRDPLRGYFIGEGDTGEGEVEVFFLSNSRVTWRYPLPPRHIPFFEDGFTATGRLAATRSALLVTTTSGWLYAFGPTASVPERSRPN